jgi:hypothetical protein
MDKTKKSLQKRLARMAKRHGIRTDAWYTSLPGTKSIEELDAQGGPWQPCRCCGYLTLSARGAGERCGVCAWVDVGDTESDAARLIAEREKTALVVTLREKLGTIDRWLDSFPEGTMSDEAAAFMYLAELVEELGLEIPRD